MDKKSPKKTSQRLNTSPFLDVLLYKNMLKLKGKENRKMNKE